jgi:hypothetical protein
MGQLAAISQKASAITHFMGNVQDRCLKALDIPHFPVQGAVFGQKHWERFEVYRQDPRFKERTFYISKGETSWRKISKQLKELGIKVNDPLEKTLSSKDKKAF